MKRNAGLGLIAALFMAGCSGSEPEPSPVASAPRFERSMAYEEIDRSQLSTNEIRLLEFFETVVDGQNDAALNDYVAEDYVSQIPGTGDGREGLREYLQAQVWPQEESRSYLVSHIISGEESDLVALHQTVRTVDESGTVTDVRPIADFARFDAAGRIAEHWRVVGGGEDVDFDAWALSEEDRSDWVDVADPIQFTGMWRFLIDPPEGYNNATWVKEITAGLPFNEEGRRRFENYDATDPRQNPVLECVVFAMPSFMIQGGALAEVTQLEDRVLLRSQDFPNEVRTIWTDGRGHPADLEPTPLGHSIGRFEGNILVIDTAGSSTGSGYDVTREGGGSSDQIKVTERWRIDPSDNTLIAEVTVEDPVYYTEPFTLVRLFPWAGGEEFIPYECAERPYIPPGA